ncbi:MAG: hypothetical protein HYT79_02565 [Elusimicrobia bacterium]|nr:hypothetical protein [Elusimicrobiota bacterium]
MKTTAQPTTAQALKERLNKVKTVEVNGLAFAIRKVSVLLLPEASEDIWNLARQGKDVLAEKIKGWIASPTLPRLRRVLLAGVISPRLSAMDEDGAMLIDLLLSDHELSSRLFLEIVNFSLEG